MGKDPFLEEYQRYKQEATGMEKIQVLAKKY
jgi:hypothetical protein